MSRALWLVVLFVAGLPCGRPEAADAPPAEQALRDHVPKPGEFPPAGAGIRMAGDLVVIDPMNRRGSLRFDGGHRSIGRWPFAMLPYGMCWYHGSPAELRDIPPGTHVHVRLLLPPEAEKNLLPQTDKLRHTHALELEDDFSFYSRRGRAWKVVAVEPGAGLNAHRFELVLDPEGPAIDGGINERMRFLLDADTRIWKERRLVAKEGIEPGQIVQVNLSWSTPTHRQEYGVTDVWLDDDSRTAFAEIQRQRHLRHQRSRWLPGWVDAVENYDRGGGVVTLTFFGGMDPLLYKELHVTAWKRDGWCAVVVANWNKDRAEAELPLDLEAMGFAGVKPESIAIRDVDASLLSYFDDDVAKLAKPKPVLDDPLAEKPEDLDNFSLEAPPTLAERKAADPDGTFEWKDGVLRAAVRRHDFRLFEFKVK